MSRRTKLEFEPLSLEETAKQLGIPRQRARRILTLIGADGAPNVRGLRAAKRPTVRHKAARKSMRSR
jgi:predicted ArsR family transcriptional regulator